MFDNVSAEVLASLVSRETNDSRDSYDSNNKPKSRAKILAERIARHARVQAEVF